MGLFGTLFDKKVCDICGQEIGFLGRRKLEDGACCKECAAKLSPWFNERRRSTVADIKKQLELRELNREQLASFNITRTLGQHTKVFLDEPAGTFIVTSSDDWEEDNPDILKLSQITSCSLDIQEHKSEIMHQVEDENGRVSWESHQPPRYTYKYDFSMGIYLNHPYLDEIRFDINDSFVEFDPISLLLDRFFLNGTSESRSAAPTKEMLRSQKEFAEFETLGLEIQDALTNPAAEEEPSPEEYEEYPVQDPISDASDTNESFEVSSEYLPDLDESQDYEPDVEIAPENSDVDASQDYESGIEITPENTEIDTSQDYEPSIEITPENTEINEFQDYEPGIEITPEDTEIDASQDYEPDIGITPENTDVDVSQDYEPDIGITPENTDVDASQDYEPSIETPENAETDSSQAYDPTEVPSDPEYVPESGEEIPVQEDAAEKPTASKSSVICPWCGAVSFGTEDGCCEYCGGSLTP